MQVLRFATREHIEAVFAENHELWGRPLSAEHYREYWYSLFLTAWGSSNLRYMALTEEEDGPLLSTLKLYRFTGKLNTKPVVVAAIGALYTPREQRTYGHASLLVSEVLDYMQKKKGALALLFTEIGAPFYERLGFLALPCSEASGMLNGPPGGQPRTAPGIAIRAAGIEDAKILASYHQRLTASDPFSIDRDTPYWAYLLFKRKRFHELAPSGSGEPLSLIALRGSTVVAGGFSVASATGVHLEECGALEHEQEALRGIIDRIWIHGLGMGARTWRGRLHPRVMEMDERLRAHEAPCANSIPMLAPLGMTGNIEGLAADPGFHILGLEYV